MADWEAIYAERERRDRLRTAVAAKRLAAKLDANPWWWQPLCMAVMYWRHKHGGKRTNITGRDSGCGFYAIDEMDGWQANAYREWEDSR